MATDIMMPTVGLKTRRWLTAGPLLAVALVWLTTAGHTLNFREMGAARGWVSAQLYSLHSSYLVAIALTLLACPRLLRWTSFRRLTLIGLGLFAVASFLNGVFLYWPLEALIAGRVLAGVGGGLILFASPGLVDPVWETTFLWEGILLPPLGPAVIAGASFAYGWSNWEGGFLFQGAFAIVCLAAVTALPFKSPSRPAVVPSWPLAYFPWLALALLGFLYCLHWGQLQGWLESPQIVFALTGASLCLVWSCWLLVPYVDGQTLRENWLRLVLFAFAGVVQFFHGTTMTIYSGLFVNYSVWQRFWLVWSMPIGAAVALALSTFWLRRAALGFGGAIAGLLVLALGMFYLQRLQMNWPFWMTENSLELNWFRVPLHWQLAPARIAVGFGFGLLLASVTARASRRADVELHVRQLAPVLQTMWGGLSIGLLVTWLLIGHQTQYSYTAENVGVFQAQELSSRLRELRASIARSGLPSETARRQALALLNKNVHYQADNLTYSQVYGVFFLTALFLAGATCLTAFCSKRV